MSRPAMETLVHHLEKALNNLQLVHDRNYAVGDKEFAARLKPGLEKLTLTAQRHQGRRVDRRLCPACRIEQSIHDAMKDQSVQGLERAEFIQDERSVLSRTPHCCKTKRRKK